MLKNIIEFEGTISKDETMPDGNPKKLIDSLERKSSQKNLLRTNDSLDESVLRFFLKKGTNNIIYHKNLELLWECCQIPDFEKRPMVNT